MKEAIFEYEIDGVRYTEDDPPQKFIDDVLKALKPFIIPTQMKMADVKEQNG